MHVSRDVMPPDWPPQNAREKKHRKVVRPRWVAGIGSRDGMGSRNG